MLQEELPVATVIRLKRIGAKKAPVYRLVITDRRNRRDGRSIEEVGIYNPTTEPATVELKEDRIKHWLGEGAQPTDTVRGLLEKNGVLGQ
jgi:small subunit ribosomal protein S16